MRRKVLPWIAWLAAGLIVLSSLNDVVNELVLRPPSMILLQLATDLAWLVFPVVFAIPAALIIAYQPRNLIGWLLLIPAATVQTPALGAAVFEANAPPAAPSALFLLYVWVDNWSWMLLIAPLLLIPLLFPDGRLPSPRWRWVIYIMVGMAFVLLFLSGFAKTYSPLNYEGRWSFENPVGFIDNQLFESSYFLIPWTAGLIAITVACVAALFVRFRRAPAMERAQIKWLLTACTFFGVVYSISAVVSDSNEEKGSLFYFLDLLVVLSFTSFPLAIAIAILRHRLFDIDIIIRKTLVYALLTGLLGLTFLGSVISLQAIFTLLFGAQSPAAIVLSTLAIAALFTPLRSRVQSFIDRRFFRQKYDAGKFLAAFARKTRDETDLSTVSSHLIQVVNETMQPEAISLWLNPNE